MPLTVELIPCLADNYAYLIFDPDDDVCAVVDPSEPEPVKRALANTGRQLKYILNTHHHIDHTGGNLVLREEFGAVVIGPEKDRQRIPGLDIGVTEAERWRFGDHATRILEIPAHTQAHIAFSFDDDRIVFTGDTLFAMGCGRLFEGTPEMMWRSLSKLMQLPDETRIYCGHEYTLGNGRFAMTLEPGNTALQARMREVENARVENRPTIPTNMGLEKATNPFLRVGSAEIRSSLGMQTADDVSVFAEIRRRKDAF